MAEQCWKCATPVRWSPGIGAFCPNADCDVLDALDSGAAFEVRIVLDPVPQPAAGAARRASPVPASEPAPCG